ncbi:MAG: hypothetical protein KDD04_10145, partial [Sinomicrobium sp.]|nr:hypothetical protein [Sinomicrobium sp.]
MTKLTIPTAKKATVFNALKTANTAFNMIYRGEREDRQAIHTVYGGANLFKYNTAQALSDIALQSLMQYAPNFAEFGSAFQLKGHEYLPSGESEQQALAAALDQLPDEALKQHPAGFSYRIYKKVIAKLKKEGVEDFRIDFEDGYGNRPDEEEDQTAVSAAREVARGMAENTLPPFIGIRIKPFTEELKE